MSIDRKKTVVASLLYLVLSIIEMATKSSRVYPWDTLLPLSHSLTTTTTGFYGLQLEQLCELPNRFHQLRFLCVSVQSLHTSSDTPHMLAPASITESTQANLCLFRLPSSPPSSDPNSSRL